MTLHACAWRAHVWVVRAGAQARLHTRRLALMHVFSCNDNSALVSDCVWEYAGAGACGSDPLALCCT